MSKQKKPVYPGGFGKGHNSLFRTGPNGKLNACVGKNGGPAGFDRYAGGFFEAGARLVKSLQENSYEVDGVIYPLVTVYRHGVEVALKHLARMLPFICDQATTAKLTHDIMDNWKIVRPCMEKLGESANGLSEIENTLKELVQIDPNGMVFRYPEDKKGIFHLQDTSIINVEVFGEGMDKLAQFMEGTCYWADYLLEGKNDQAQEEREAEREMADYYGWDGY